VAETNRLFISLIIGMGVVLLLIGFGFVLLITKSLKREVLLRSDLLWVSGIERTLCSPPVIISYLVRNHVMELVCFRSVVTDGTCVGQ
jgi:hypothetical protein